MSSAIDDGPLNLNLGACRSGVGVRPDHDPDGMFSHRQTTDMPIVVIGRIFGDPGIDFAGLLAIEENVGAAALLRAAAHDGHPCPLECERCLSTGRSGLLELKLAAPGQLE